MYDSRFVAALLAFTVLSTPAHAYLGPGMGAGTIAVVLGIVASVFIALFAIIWYPVKRMMKRRQNPAKTEDDVQTQTPDGEK